MSYVDLGHPGAMPGDRVRLVYMPDNYLNLRPGETGTIRLVDLFGTIHVSWDDGSYFGLVPGVDRLADRFIEIKKSKVTGRRFVRQPSG